MHILIAGVSLLLFGLLSYYLKTPYYKTPLDRDFGGHGMISLAWMRKKGLIYRDIYDSKTPGLKLIYMLIIRYLGISRKSFRLFFNLYNLLTLAAVYLLAYTLFGVVAAVCATGLYALYSSMPSLWWHFSNTEEYYILPTILSLFFLICGFESAGTPGVLYAAAGGLLGGVAFMFKQTSAINTLVFFLFFFFPGHFSWVGIAGYLGGLLIPFAAFGVYFFGMKKTPIGKTPFGPWVVGTLIRYLRAPSFKDTAVSAHSHRQTLRRIFYDHSFLALLCTGFGLLALSTRNPTMLMIALWGAFALVSMVASRTYLPYHFIPLVPPACIMSGFVFSFAINRFSSGGIQAASPDLLLISGGAVLLLAAGYHLWKDLFQTPANLFGAMYSGVDKMYELVEEVGKYIKGQTKENDTVYSWGWEQGVFLWSERIAPTYLMYAPVIIPGSMTPGELEEHYAELRAKKPKFIVVTANFDKFKEFETYLTKNYTVDKKYPPLLYLFRLRPQAEPAQEGELQVSVNTL